mgnify:CR=1 FL=1
MHRGYRKPKAAVPEMGNRGRYSLSHRGSKTVAQGPVFNCTGGLKSDTEGPKTVTGSSSSRSVSNDFRKVPAICRIEKNIKENHRIDVKFS